MDRRGKGFELEYLFARLVEQWLTFVHRQRLIEGALGILVLIDCVKSKVAFLGDIEEDLLQGRVGNTYHINSG